MFLHNYHYSLRLLLRNRNLVFWTLAFPLIMALLFNMAFSNIESDMTFAAIDIAVVSSKEFEDNTIFKETLESLSECDDRIFNITYTDEKTAKKKLENSEITGFLTFSDDGVKVTVHSEGMNETILTSVVNEISVDSSVIMRLGTQEIIKSVFSGKRLSNDDYEKLFRDISERFLNDDNTIKEETNGNASFVMIEYYTLIAMSCIYSGLFSMTLINYMLANVSAVGKRTSVSPVKKGGMIAGSLAAGFTVQLVGLALLYALMLFVLHVDFGTKLPLIILLSLAGSLAGLTMGLAVATLVKSGENVKITVMISVTMAGCFLAGMMGISMKNVIDKNVPFLNMINPVAMITDALYALYYYSSEDRFWFDMISLVAFSAVMILISLRGLRRQRYDSL